MLTSLNAMHALDALPELRLLLVEDDEDDALLTTSIFNKIPRFSLKTDWVDTSRKALEKLHAQPDTYDGVFVDHRLQQEFGLDLIEKITVHYPFLPVILLTGSDDPVVDEEAARRGASDFLVKGEISPRLVERSLRYAMAHKQILRQLSDNEKERERVFATLAHDLKTPIRAEYNVLKMLGNQFFGPLTNEQEGIINELLKSNRFKHHLVDNLLNAYKATQSTLNLTPQETDLNALVHSLLSGDIHFFIEEKKLVIRFALAETLPLVVCDAFEVSRVIRNLIHNAILHSPYGASLTLVTHRSQDDICFEVSDEGPGIPPAKAGQLFQAFQSHSDQYKHIGTGLGLFLSKTIVEAHGGTIGFENTPPKGCRFFFTLPVHSHLPLPQEDVGQVVEVG